MKFSISKFTQKRGVLYGRAKKLGLDMSKNPIPKITVSDGSSTLNFKLERRDVDVMPVTESGYWLYNTSDGNGDITKMIILDEFNTVSWKQ